LIHIKTKVCCPANLITVRKAIVARRAPEEIPMMDVLMIAIGVAFFVLAIGYVVACDRM